MYLKQLLLIFIMVFLGHQVQASHVMGGEITWECAGANQYQFQLVIYRDCNGQDIIANNLDIDVWGHPTVSAVNCLLIETIDLSPPCTQVPTGPIQLDCGVGTQGGNGAGAIQKYIYRSNPITLSGTPPAGGWSFTYDDWSRSWSLTNIQTPATYGMTLSATMYAISGATLGQCVDSSPQFAQDPYLLLCAGTDFEFDSNVYDPNNDSLAFSWGTPLDHFPTGSFDPPNNPIPVPFVTGFSATNPTPDATFDAANVPASIDPNTGVISYTSNTTGNYVMVQKIDSYRGGDLVSTINREIQLVIINCAGVTNTAPSITPPFAGNTSFDVEYFAGELIDFDIIIQDLELLQDGTLQTVSLTPSGNAFGTNLTDANGGCDILPCATMDQPPIIMGVQGVNAHFNWQTDCAHLKDANGVQQEEQTYSFVFKAQDDYCSVPGLTYKTVNIKLKNSSMTPADMNCISAGPFGEIEIHWTKSNLTEGTFDSYEIWSIQNGLIAVLTDINIEYYLHAGANANVAPKDYYVLTKYGCNGDSFVSSDTLTSMYLDLNDLGDGRVSLSWNATHDPLNNGDAQVQNIMREFSTGIWSQRDQVANGITFFQDTIDICDAWQNYRIEVGNVAGCISKSSIDGDQLQDIINPYIPIVTSVSVDTVTDAMEITWNQNQSKDTYGYIIYQNIGGFWDPIDTVYGITTTSYQNTNTNSMNSSETYGIAAFDSCLTNTTPTNYQTSALSKDHSSIFLTNELNICSKEVTLNWEPYDGFEIDRYEVICKIGNSSYEIIETIDPALGTYVHPSLMVDVTYHYYIRAVSTNGVEAYSNKNTTLVIRPTAPAYHYLSTATHLLSNEIEVECYTDPGAAVQGYEIERKGPYDTDFAYLTTVGPLTNNIFNYADADIDSRTGAYNYRVTLIDSCGNSSDQTDVATTIFLRVTTQDVEMKTTLAWSDYVGFDGVITEYRVFRGINGVFEPTPIAVLSPNIRSYVDDIESFYDSEGQFCYRVEAIEALNSYGFSQTTFSNTVCVTIEPIVYIPNAFTINGHNPVFLPIISLYDFESYDLQIYNRWGEIVFNTIDRDLGWNGEGNDGGLKSEGVYVYLLRFKDEFGKEYEFKGSLTMLYSNTD